MAIRVSLNHKTEYRYDREVQLTPQVVRLRPAPHCRTPIVSYSLRIQPAEHFINWQQDPYSNYQARLVFSKPTNVFSVEVDLTAELSVINPFDFFLDPTAERVPIRYEEQLVRELASYLEKEPAGPLLQGLVDEFNDSDAKTIDYIVAINQRLNQAVRYVIRMEPGIQACEETLTLQSGSCRDSAWLLVQLFRHLGIAARFVSGYLIQLKPDIVAIDGPQGAAEDFTDLHAWTEVYLPGAGWVGLDPTSGLLVGEGHIPLACAADPTNASPISGSFTWNKRPGESEDEKCETEFSFHMSITRVHEDPRVTKPYTDEQWQSILDLGRRIDEQLLNGDVRLTMGGEPTFVSVDDMEGAEWNVTALGPTKRVLAGALLNRLRDRFAPGAFLHYGQGKWYPGEPLPRWALSCYWRRDGVPLWEDPSLYADETRNYGHAGPQARAFIEALARALNVDPANSRPGYEDVWYYLWKERQLPVDIDPLARSLDDPEERKTLARVFEQGLNHVVGYALPLRRDPVGSQRRWVSGPWALRRGHLFLMPGDSPMGFRLPLDSLPWQAPQDLEPVVELDPQAPRDSLPKLEDLLKQRRISLPSSYGQGREPGTGPPQSDPSAPFANASTLVRTSLCVEPRDGRLYIFMPPLSLLEDYLELVSAIEGTADALNLPVLVEGYGPPTDHRINHLSVTPDPGVIEVNMHPAHSWDELVDQTTTLYEEARQTRLGTEKFMVDGRHTGTGGGNHIVLGGTSPADSPLLRRPDLLRSLVAYWHNHPSLSYLFSGMFVGPTSQAPRIDEARNDSLYEMEIAFQQIPDHGTTQPWLVDRVFRHLLTDVTGNTHRAEFCIDKLYSPDSSSGRRGLLEMRGFEMPPDVRMSLVQQLLIRSLVARFWDQPYNRQLARWGTELHDRFMLPHFIFEDFADVITELQESGLPLEREWFVPHFEFRFPRFGEVAYKGVDMELRQAIEPWHVLGEEAGPGSTVRYVDSSVERLELKVQGMTNTRHTITCNGRPLPLHPTGTNGEFVAGVRYRAWQPPSCLHPTIRVHAPLVFDLVDTWMARSLGGFTYHVSHPGGRSFDTMPVNAYEAESRRIARFVPFGHSPGKLNVPKPARSLEAPFTLDLRWS